MALVAQKLVKSYGRRVVVNQVDLELRRGEIVGLLGPNGAGKTTTFALIVGLERAESGQIFYDGLDVTDFPMYKRSRLGLGYLPQEPSVFRKLSVEDNLRAVLQLTGDPKSKQLETLEDLLKEFNLEKVRYQRGYELSGETTPYRDCKSFSSKSFIFVLG